MGTLIIAHCKCGYENKKIHFGAGMDDDGICYVPALKNGSYLIEMKDIRKAYNHLEYVFYTENLLYISDGLAGFYNAWEFKLKKEGNLCPQCKKYRMNFLYVGEYD